MFDPYMVGVSGLIQNLATKKTVDGSLKLFTSSSQRYAKNNENAFL